MKTILLACIAIFIIAVAFYQQPEVVNPMGSTSDNVSTENKASASIIHAEAAHSHKSDSLKASVSKDAKPQLSTDQSSASHLDQISPEMREQIKSKLLFHAPIETIQRADGSVLMNPNGRSAQMPVAVQMPDGSIVVKEYSFIPEDDK
ncbi:MAG: hypothetical protein ACI843_001707 [Psychrobacter glaciei]|jgi:hypothetical protein